MKTPSEASQAAYTVEDEDFEEVLCEHECRAGFRVLLGRSVIVLICNKCRLEYDLSQDRDSQVP